MNDSQRSNLRRHMLKILSDCAQYKLPLDTFFEHTRLSLTSTTRDEFETERKWLEGNNYIAGINPELGGPSKWKLTEDGKLALNP